MGITFIKMEVANPANPKITKPVDFLVDSGAIYSVVPTPILEKLGIKPVSKEEFTLANGERIRRKKGVALFKYKDKVGGADVVFGEKDDSTLLGAFTLEALGLALDPLKRELKPLPLILAQKTFAKLPTERAAYPKKCHPERSGGSRFYNGSGRACPV